MVTQYRGVEQLVARRAHNPKVMWFKSLLRNQISTEVLIQTSVLLFYLKTP